MVRLGCVTSAIPASKRTLGRAWSRQPVLSAGETLLARTNSSGVKKAMTACAVAALTIYDMVKGIERGVQIEQVVLLEKRGGRSDYKLAE